MSIVMGVDQHRAQITAEWIDLVSGEISRARVRPADRAGVRKFLARFAGEQLEVALEATTGWRFLVEELRAVGAVVHLAEPAETAARRGNKKRAKTDRADARHHRELLLAGRLPESWIPPDHILDLRAQVRLRHTLIEQHSEWQQRIQAVLYHHGCPRRRQLMKGDGRDWLQSLALPAAARQQITVSLQMTDALDVQLAPLTKELRDYAPADRVPGAGRPVLRDRRAVRGHDPRRARRLPTVLQQPRRGPLRRDGHHRVPVRSPPRTGTPLPTRTARTALGAVRGRPRRAPARLTGPRLLPAGSRAPGRQPRLPGACAQAPQTLLPHPTRARRRLTRATLADEQRKPSSAAGRRASSGQRSQDRACSRPRGLRCSGRLTRASAPLGSTQRRPAGRHNRRTSPFARVKS